MQSKLFLYYEIRRETKGTRKKEDDLTDEMSIPITIRNIET